MKKLIFPLIFLTVSYHLKANEIMEPGDGKNIVAQIQDLEVEEMLKQTSEFQECRKMYDIQPGESDESKNNKLKAAETCFQKKLKNKSVKDLEKLSDQLNLQHYGLIQSKNVKDIQKYLNDKLYKAMTGVSLEEKNAQKLKEDLKFGKRKILDQGVFIEMYKTQLGKNALHEVSRFCFENLRLNVPEEQKNIPTTFGEHWKDFDKTLTLSQLNDLGLPPFGTYSDPNDKSKVYTDLFNNIQGASKTLSKEILENFFLACGKMIPELCKLYKSSIKLEETQSKVDSNNMSVGANACLSMSRIQEYRKALANADKIIKEMEKTQDSDKTLRIMLSGIDGKPIKVFGDGKDPNEESIDELTNFTSKDLLEGGVVDDDELDEMAQKCREDATLDNCKAFTMQGDNFDKAKQSIERELTLKREVEMARIRKIVEDNPKDLKKYLEDNGHMDILEEYNKRPNMTADEIAKLIGQSYEARKTAILQQLNTKLGKRQTVKSEDGKQETVSASNVEEVIKETKEERARMAQVVLFNNIITSHIDLKKKDSKESVGRNIGAWKKEEKALAEAKVDESLFENLKASTAGEQGIGKDAQISSFGILDEILGKEPEK